MRKIVGALSFTAKVALSLAGFATAIFSEASAATNTLAFALSRLDAGMSVELRNSVGAILACGKIAHVQMVDGILHLETLSDRENLPDCGGDSRQESIPMREIEFAEIISPQAEFYVFDKTFWKYVRWKKPIRANGDVFKDYSGIPEAWRRYNRPAKIVPAMFWPEVRIGAGAYALSGVRDLGLSAAMALDFKLHRLLYPLSIVTDFTWAARQKNGNEGLVSPEQFFILDIAAKYAVLNRRAVSLAIAVGGGIVSYRVDGEPAHDWGLRPILVLGVLVTWHLHKNNVDWHKISLFFEPRAAVFINRYEKDVLAWPFLADVHLGVQYGI